MIKTEPTLSIVNDFIQYFYDYSFATKSFIFSDNISLIEHQLKKGHIKDAIFSLNSSYLFKRKIIDTSFRNEAYEKLFNAITINIYDIYKMYNTYNEINDIFNIILGCNIEDLDTFDVFEQKINKEVVLKAYDTVNSDLLYQTLVHLCGIIVLIKHNKYTHISICNSYI